MSPRPMTLTEAQKAEVETLAAVLTAEQVADYFGIGRRTFYRLMQRDEEIAARYKKGKARVIGVIAQGLINKARAGDTASMIFFLKTQAGWRETMQLAPADPHPAEPIDLSGVSISALRELTAAMRRSREAPSALIDLQADPRGEEDSARSLGHGGDTSESETWTWRD